MKLQTAIAGNKGKDVRSDCHVECTITESEGISISLNSRNEALYGDQIRALAERQISSYGVKNCNCVIDDSGALDFVIMARIEAVLSQLLDGLEPFLPEMNPENTNNTQKDRLRFSRLYLPGNSPKLFLNAGIHKPHGLILDLEDSVAPAKKTEARFIVRNALRSLNFYGAERMVRINQVPEGIQDLDYIIPHHVNLVLVPKCETASQIHDVNNRITELRNVYGFEYDIWLMPIIESALGVINAFEIASAADNIASLAIGLEDFTADLGVSRTNTGKESFHARCQIVLACSAAGIQAIDSVFSDVADSDALAEAVKESKSIGFDGMGCIHPRQIRIIHENFAPSEKEITKAKKIILAFDEAMSKGLGVVALGSKMIDPPVVKRAETTIKSAIATSKLDADWKTSENL